MKSYYKYWFLVLLLLVVSCADSLLVSTGLASPLAAFVVALIASLAGWIWLVKTIQKDRAQITAYLRNPELKRPGFQHKNFFGNIFAEAIQKIEESDTELVSTKQVKTMLKARLNSLSKKELMMESVLESLDTGILLFDAQHELEFSNTAANTFLIPEANQRENITDSSLSLSKALINNAVVPELAQLLAKTIERKAATLRRRTEFDFIANGSTSHYCAVATNLHDENEAILGTVIVVENIGEENIEKARHAEFVSSVAHELKTPMSGIKAYVEMLVDGGV